MNNPLSVVFICGQSSKHNLASCAYVRVRTFALRVHKSVHESLKRYSSTKSMRATALRGRMLMNKKRKRVLCAYSLYYWLHASLRICYDSNTRVFIFPSSSHAFAMEDLFVPFPFTIKGVNPAIFVHATVQII